MIEQQDAGIMSVSDGQANPLGSGKRVLPNGVHATFGLMSATPYPSGVVGLHYSRQRGTT